MIKPDFCELCPLASEPFVPPTCNCPICSEQGPASAIQILTGERNCMATVLVIGMAPGAEEVKRGLVLVGPSGRILQSAFDIAGLSREHVRKLNLVQCRTSRPGITGPVNRDPLNREIDYCRRHFLDPELQAFQARDGVIVILLGGLVYTHVANEAFGPFAEAQGHRFLIDSDGRR